eukprot:711692_1
MANHEANSSQTLSLLFFKQNLIIVCSKNQAFTLTPSIAVKYCDNTFTNNIKLQNIHDFVNPITMKRDMSQVENNKSTAVSQTQPKSKSKRHQKANQKQPKRHQKQPKSSKKPTKKAKRKRGGRTAQESGSAISTPSSEAPSSKSSSNYDWDYWKYDTTDSDHEWSGSSEEINQKILNILPKYNSNRRWSGEFQKRNKFSVGKTTELIIDHWIRLHASHSHGQYFDSNLTFVMSSFVMTKSKSFQSIYKRMEMQQILNLIESGSYSWINIDTNGKVRQMIAKYDQPKDYVLTNEFIKNFTTNKNGKKVILLSLYNTNKIIILCALDVYLSADDTFKGRTHQTCIDYAQSIYSNHILSQVNNTEHVYKMDYIQRNGWHTLQDDDFDQYLDKLTYDAIVLKLKHVRDTWLKSKRKI